MPPPVKARVPLPVVLSGGFLAYAFGNTIGLTAVSGAAVRWRLYSGLGLDGYDIAAVSTFTAMAFGVAVTLVGLAALAVHPAALASFLPLSASSVRLQAIGAILIVVLPLLWASMSRRQLRIGRFTLTAPSPSPRRSKPLSAKPSFPMRRIRAATIMAHRPTTS